MEKYPLDTHLGVSWESMVEFAPNGRWFECAKARFPIWKSEVYLYKYI